MHYAAHESEGDGGRIDPCMAVFGSYKSFQWRNVVWVTQGKGALTRRNFQRGKLTQKVTGEAPQ